MTDTNIVPQDIDDERLTQFAAPHAGEPEIGEPDEEGEDIEEGEEDEDGDDEEEGDEPSNAE